MTRWQVYLVLALGLFGLGLGTGLGWGAHHASKKAVQAQTQADQHEGAAQTHAAQAAASDQQAITQQATVTTADARAAAAKRELDRRLAALHGDAPASHSPASVRADGAGRANLPEIPDSSALPSFPEIPDNSDELAATQAALALTQAALAEAQAVIAAQGDQLAARDRLIASLTASRDQWHAAYEESQKALALQKIAANAAVHSEARRGFLHSLETGLATAALGYAAGRTH